MPSPTDEAFLSEELGERLRLLRGSSGNHLGAALRGRRREAADVEDVGRRDRVPRGVAQGRGGDLTDRLARRLHDRREGRAGGDRKGAPRGGGCWCRPTDRRWGGDGGGGPGGPRRGSSRPGRRR